MKNKRPDVKYKTVAVDVMMEENPVWFGEMLARIKRRVESGMIKPLPLKIFNMRGSEENGIDAFRFMQRAQHIGKVIIKIPSISSEKSNEIEECLITGGSGSLGFVLTEYLVNEGFTEIKIVSRFGPEKQNKLLRDKWYELTRRVSSNMGNNRKGITFLNCDVSSEESMTKLINTEFSNLKHVFHLAGVISDDKMELQTRESIEKTYKPKAIGAWNLHRVFDKLGIEKEIRSFVCYSSISSGLGNFGQTNYSAANSCLDSLVEYRRTKGLPATSIQWGAWEGEGMASGITESAKMLGMDSISNKLGELLINDILTEVHYNLKDGTVMCLPIKWNVYFDFVYAGERIPMFSNIKTKEINENNEFNIMSSIPDEEREAYIEKHIVLIANSVLGVEIKSFDQPLQDLGVDSLAALEFRNALSKKFNIKLSATTLFDYPTLKGVKNHIYEKVSTRKCSNGVNDILPNSLNYNINTPDNTGVIVGMACRLPGGSNTPGTLWRSLMLGYSKNPLTGKKYNSINGSFCASKFIPNQRWNHNLVYNVDPDKSGKCYSYQACFIDSIDLFDNSKFGITNIEAKHMDPQQRIMLETSYEAIKAANIKEESIVGQQIGVFVGCCSNDWSYLQSRRGMASFTGTGAANTTISNRVSYVFGIRGPSMTIDTACASSLTATCVAMDCLKNNECIGAIVSGVNALLSPNLFIAFCKARMLSRDGKCKTFDASADGYVRGEGCGSIFILNQREQKKLETPVLGIIKGWGCNHVGKSASLTAPNGPAQANVIKMALNNARIKEFEIDYIETHGTGTALGDPIELGALKSIFGGKSESKRSKPLVLGALKTNIGHLEGAAGIAGLIKLIMVLSHATAPKLAHLTKINPHLDLENFHVIIPQNVTPLDSSKTKLYGGVSGFGFGGCNSHVIIESVEKKQQNYFGDSENLVRSIVFVFAGQGSQYVNMCKELYEKEPIFRENLDLCDKIASKIINRSLIEIIYPNKKTTDAFNSDQKLLNDTRYTQPAIFSVEYSLAKLWISKGIQPDKVLGHSLGEFVAAAISGVMDIEDAVTLVTQRANIMASTPAFDGIMVACRLSELKVREAIKKLELEDTASIAAVNGPKSVTISGKRDSVMKILEHLEIGNKYRQLEVSHAFHSPLVSVASKKFGDLVDKIKLRIPNIEFISTVTGEAERESLVTCEYWKKHILKTVRLSDAVTSIIESSNSSLTFVEISSKPVLSQLLKALIPSNSDNKITVVCTSKSQDSDFNYEEPLNKVSELLFGNKYNTKNINDLDDDSWRYRILKRRQFSWNTTVHPIISPLHDFNDVEWVKENVQINKPSRKNPLDRLEFNCSIGMELLDLLDNHKVLGQSILPGAAYVDFIATSVLNYATSQLTLGEINSIPDWIKMKGIFFRSPFLLSSAHQYKFLNPKSKNTTRDESNNCISDFNIVVSKGNNCHISIESQTGIDEEKVIYATCDEFDYISNNEAQKRSSCILAEWPAEELISSSEKISSEKIYEKMSIAGLQYGSRFKTLKEMWKITTNSAVGIIQNEFLDNIQENSLDPLSVNETFMNENGFTVHPTLLDGVLHICAPLLEDGTKESLNNSRQPILVPVSINECIISSKVETSKYIKGDKYFAFVQLINSDKDGAIVDVSLKNASGVPIAIIFGVSLRYIKNGVISTHSIKQNIVPKELLWRTQWCEVCKTIKKSEIDSLIEIINSCNLEKNLSDVRSNMVIQRLRVLMFSNSNVLNKDEFNSDYFITNVICNATELSYSEIEAAVFEKEFQGLPPSPSNESKWDLICLHIPNTSIKNAVESLSPLLNLCKLVGTMYENKKRWIPKVTVITENSFYINDFNLELNFNSGISSFIKSARQELELLSVGNTSFGLIDIESTEELLNGILLSLSKDILCANKNEDIFKNDILSESQISFLNTSYEREYALRRIKNEGKIKNEQSYSIYVSRLVSLSAEMNILGSSKLNMSSRGSINNLELQPLSLEERVPPSKERVEIR
ncbi:type I fatty acid synthase, partial [Cryptosporidium ryanae]|uniref:type I fatty acid synthase n=1 Tax=Cryptosporidium ryanae TaxID=515981 RepID=UPI00351A0EC1